MTTNADEDRKRRDRHDIIAEILKTAVEGKIKTHIMYKARLSYTQLNEYLPPLVEKGFLESITAKRRKQDTTIFKTTPKGMRFIENFESINELWSNN